MDKQQRRKEKLLRLAATGGTDKDLAIFDAVNELEDKFDGLVEEITTKGLEEIKKEIPTSEEVAQHIEAPTIDHDAIVAEVLRRIPPQEKIDTKQIALDVLKEIPTPKEAEAINYDFIVSEVARQIPPKIEQITQKVEITPQEVKELLLALPDDEKIGLDAFKPTDKYITPDVLNRAIEILDRRTQFLINKQVASVADAGNIIDNEVPTGTINGVNTEFTLSQAPSPVTSLKVFVNGLKLTLTEDYTLSGTTLTFVVAPETNDIITCDYRY